MNRRLCLKMHAIEWNEKYPVGTRVRYWPVKGERDFVDSKTRSEAWVIGCGNSIVKIEGRAGGVHLDHLEVL